MSRSLQTFYDLMLMHTLLAPDANYPRQTFRKIPYVPLTGEPKARSVEEKQRKKEMRQKKMKRKKRRGF